MTVFLNGEAIAEPDKRGSAIKDDSFLLLFHAHSEDQAFTIPGQAYGERWEVVLDTHAPRLDEVEERAVKTGEPFDVPARSVLLLRKVF